MIKMFSELASRLTTSRHLAGSTKRRKVRVPKLTEEEKSRYAKIEMDHDQVSLDAHLAHLKRECARRGLLVNFPRNDN